MKNKIVTIILYFISFVAILLFCSAIWVKKTFGQISIDSFFYTVTSGLEGTESGMVFKYFTGPFLIAVLIIIAAIVIPRLNYKNIPFLNFKIFKFKFEWNIFKIIDKIKIAIPFILLVGSMFFVYKYFDIEGYIRTNLVYTTFIEDHYVDPKTAKIEFKEKRNLIHIYVESLEVTFSDKANGGVLDFNLIPNLTNLSKEEDSVRFSSSTGLGFYNTRATNWTIAGMLGQTAGINLITYHPEDYGATGPFLPGVYSLGEILADNGYKNVLFIGSDANFGARNNYFEKHGNYEIKDYYYAIEKGYIPGDYYEWWGIEDGKLFEFAKKEINELAQGDQPFNFTMLTTNTHHIGGFTESFCEKTYDESQYNAIKCSDQEVYDFVRWIQDQDFYENTTIVITGDHISMEPELFEQYESFYDRTCFNLFINPYKKTEYTNNRLFTTLDIYPTTVYSLGGEIEGNKLGLGVNLFSGEKTLYETYGRMGTEYEMQFNSKFYQEKLMKNK